MMRKHLFKLLLLLSILSYSQEAFYEIKYSVNLDNLYESVKKNKTDGNLQFYNSIAKAAKNVSLELLISNNISIFKESKGVTFDGLEGIENIVKAFSYEGNWMYNNLSKKVIFVNSYQGRDFFVDKKVKIRNWKFTNEFKTILGFRCKKATYIRDDVPNKGNNEVIAWYTTEIKLPYGPSNYSGQLPGLILELDELIAVYKVTSIKKVKYFKIKWPNEKDIISEEAYKKEGEKVMDFYKKMN